MVNEVRLIGNLGVDPEVRHLSADSAVASFSLATSESYIDKKGEKVTNTEWHRVQLWGKLAGIAEKYLKKGSQVYISGSIRYDKYEKDGETKYITKINGTVLKMLGSKSGSEGADLPF